MDETLSPPQWIRDQGSQDPHKEDILFPTEEQWKKLPRAEQGDFIAGLHIQSNDGAADGGGYVLGYRRAAQVLAEASVKSRFDRNVLVYPILYLYRHAVELHLKRVIPVAAKLIDQPLEENETKQLGEKATHRLGSLWLIFRPRLEQMRKNGLCDIGEDALADIDSYIHQLNAVDENAESFRYASSKSGDPHLGSLKRIDVVRITKMMERLANYFEGFDDIVHEQYQVKCQALAEARELEAQGAVAP